MGTVGVEIVSAPAGALAALPVSPAIELALLVAGAAAAAWASLPFCGCTAAGALALGGGLGAGSGACEVGAPNGSFGIAAAGGFRPRAFELRS
ncbi:MAG TPA: hypothetical protein VFE12_17100, partial [Acetobacteraceae bacterium]|nr:hypothetical protein [Acetobacteraceae bacterium]